MSSEGMPMLAGGGGFSPNSAMAQGQMMLAANKLKGGAHRMVFFGCSMLVVVASVCGFISTFTSVFFNPFDLIIFGYLAIFGFVLCLLDAPSEHLKLLVLRGVIYKFCLFMTRLAGRGLLLIFLGCMVCANLWDNNISPFIGFLIFGILVAVGVFALYTSMKISKKLEAVRRALLNRGGPTPSICPPQGLRLDKFGELALKIQGVTLYKEELDHIGNALSKTPQADDVISQHEFEVWLRDTTPLII